MTYELEPTVVDEIARCFDPADISYVANQLRTTKLTWKDIAPLPRVQIAVIWLSEGDREKFDAALLVAYYDWRKTLMAAGLADEDWREILNGRGIDASQW